ncbi:hypothetical protein BGZ65_012806 [Modicella reniformis]|uniref:BRCT domain-containing protein n=1 Tax=Modicella reniformis TaxID=1440133 RepID=A0A9P6M1A5_9FUNG|nr:hypothetical protein BGZ65_012806 [Modicella reniformis]
MTETYRLASCFYSKLETSPEDLPVARLWVEKYNDLKETYFPLYKGRNPVGSNPHVVKAYIPEKYKVNEVHILIDIDKIAVILDPFERDSDAQSKLDNVPLPSGAWMVFPEDKKLQLLGGIELRIELLPEEERKIGPLRRELLPLIATACETYSLDYKQYRPIQPRRNIAPRQPAFGSQDSIVSDTSPDPTLSIESMTVSAHCSLDSASSEAPDHPSFSVEQGPILPPEIMARNRELITNDGLTTSHVNIAFDLEPTQILGQHDSYDTELMEASTLSYDSAYVAPGNETRKPSSPLSPLHEELDKTQQILQEEVEHASAELESVSQESEVISVSPSEQIHIFDERVPATPVELIDSAASSRGNIQNVDPGSSKDQLIQDNDKVPQTPEELRYTAMSEISAFETHGESSDEPFGSLSRDNPSRSVKREEETCTVNKGKKKQQDSSSPRRSERYTKEKAKDVCKKQNDTANSKTENSEEDDPPLQRHRRSSKSIKESQDSVLSSPPQVSESSSKSTSPGAVDSTRRTVLRSKERSPKHRMDNDTGEGSSKPSKLIKAESTDEAAESTTNDNNISPIKHFNEVTIEKLGGIYKEEYKETTILVFDGTSRTAKLMCAIVRGTPIVTQKWLDDSKSQQKFLRCEDYLFSDPTIEEKYEFNMAEIFQLAKVNLRQTYKSNPPSLWQPAIFALDPKATSMAEFNLGLYRIIKMDSSETARYAGRYRRNNVSCVSCRHSKLRLAQDRAAKQRLTQQAVSEVSLLEALENGCSISQGHIYLCGDSNLVPNERNSYGEDLEWEWYRHLAQHPLVSPVYTAYLSGLESSTLLQTMHDSTLTNSGKPTQIGGDAIDGCLCGGAQEQHRCRRRLRKRVRTTEWVVVDTDGTVSEGHDEDSTPIEVLETCWRPDTNIIGY